MQLAFNNILQISKYAINFYKTPVGPEDEGNIIRDPPIQCNDRRDDRDRNEYAAVGVEEEEGVEAGRNLDSNPRSSGITHIFLVPPWL